MLNNVENCGQRKNEAPVQRFKRTHGLAGLADLSHANDTKTARLAPMYPSHTEKALRRLHDAFTYLTSHHRTSEIQMLHKLE